MCTCVQKSRTPLAPGKGFHYKFDCTDANGSHQSVSLDASGDSVAKQLAEMELLQEMRFEATLPNGDKLDVEGFLTVDEKKLEELPDDKVLQLHRSGLLALLQMHRVSMGNMSKLANQYGQAVAATT